MNQETPVEFEQIRNESAHIWDQNAEFWDGRMQEGNAFHRELIGPTCEQLLTIQQNETILELGCGNGQFAQHMARLGARVLATDVSHRMLELAQGRTPQGIAERLTWQRLDATAEEDISVLGEKRFDAVVCNQTLMDIPVIEPLMRGVHHVLKPDGRFVFSLMHPCFNGNQTKGLEMDEDEQGRMRERRYVKVWRYLSPTTMKGEGMEGQPLTQFYFFRPLHILFGAAFQAGFVIDGLEEPAFREANGEGLNWQAFPEIPPVLVVRLRPAPGRTN